MPAIHLVTKKACSAQRASKNEIQAKGNGYYTFKKIMLDATHQDLPSTWCDDRSGLGHSEM